MANRSLTIGANLLLREHASKVSYSSTLGWGASVVKYLLRMSDVPRDLPIVMFVV
jgi:hypothetical protein